MPTHSLMGGKLHVYKRENSRYWQCSTYLNGKNRSPILNSYDEIYEFLSNTAVDFMYVDGSIIERE